MVETGVCEVCSTFDNGVLVNVGRVSILVCGECLGRYPEFGIADAGGALDADWLGLAADG